MSRHLASETVVSIRGLDHSYGEGALRKQVLFDVELVVFQGQIVLLTGPSGCGKTTLLTLIGGLRAVQSGSVRVLGQELNGADRRTLTEARRHHGFIFQAQNLHGSLTALENVRMGLEVHGVYSPEEMRTLSVQMLEQVGLDGYFDKYPAQLSGGQKQRVTIARALVSHPKIVLADEPTAALDRKSGREVVEVMQSLAREQRTAILLVTHDNRISDIADRIIEMEDGRLQGTRGARGVSH